MKFQVGRLKSGERGSAVLMVTMMMAAFAVSTYVMTSSATRSTALQQQKLMRQEAESVAQSIGTVLANRNVCLSGLDGAGPEPGLQFYDAAGAVSNFDPALAASANGQTISIPSPYTNAGGGHLLYASGLQLPNTKLQINRLYIANPVVDPNNANLYTVQVRASVQSTAQNALPVRPRVIEDLKILVGGAGGAMTDCNYTSGASSNQAVCQSLGCTYTVSASGSGGTCYCKLDPITCTGGRYITSFTGSLPTCSTNTITKSCANNPNSLIAGVDANGDPICATISACPAGTSSVGLGGAASPPQCRCANAGEVWNGTACVVPTNGVCGLANGTSVASAPALNLCSSGTPSGVTGTGPWSWTCNGNNGGSNSSCSANTTVVSCSIAGSSATGAGPATSQAGCNCNNASDTWNGTACVLEPTSCGSTVWVDAMKCNSASVPISVTAHMEVPDPTWTVDEANCKAICDATPGATCCDLQDIAGGGGPGGGPGVRCRVYGAGAVIVSAPSYGSAICSGAPSGPTCSIAGSSATGAGPATSESGCKCNNASDTWNGSACVASTSFTLNGYCYIMSSVSTGSAALDLCSNYNTAFSTYPTGGGQCLTVPLPQAAVGRHCVGMSDDMYVELTPCLVMDSPITFATDCYYQHLDGNSFDDGGHPRIPKSILGGSCPPTVTACGTAAAAVTCSITGSSTSGAGPATSQSGCNCNNATDTWNGTSCVAAISCASSSATLFATQCPDMFTVDPYSPQYESITSCLDCGPGKLAVQCSYGNSSIDVGGNTTSSRDAVRWFSYNAGTYYDSGDVWIQNSNPVSVWGNANYPYTVFPAGSCTGTTAPTVVNGICGTANSTSITSAPNTATQLCSAGSATSVSGTGPWLWSCNGANGGSSSSCQANLAVSSQDGVCGTAQGTSMASAPTTAVELCAVGTNAGVSGTGPWNWSCNGLNGGNTASCFANLAVTAINGSCGSAQGASLSSAPTTAAQLCSAGTNSSVSGSGPWNWTCNGSNGGTNASCSANSAGGGPCIIYMDAVDQNDHCACSADGSNCGAAMNCSAIDYSTPGVSPLCPAVIPPPATLTANDCKALGTSTVQFTNIGLSQGSISLGTINPSSQGTQFVNGFWSVNNYQTCGSMDSSFNCIGTFYGTECTVSRSGVSEADAYDGTHPPALNVPACMSNGDTCKFIIDRSNGSLRPFSTFCTKPVCGSYPF